MTGGKGEPQVDNLAKAFIEDHIVDDKNSEVYIPSDLHLALDDTSCWSLHMEKGEISYEKRIDPQQSNDLEIFEKLVLVPPENSLSHFRIETRINSMLIGINNSMKVEYQWNPSTNKFIFKYWLVNFGVELQMINSEDHYMVFSTTALKERFLFSTISRLSVEEFLTLLKSNKPTFMYKPEENEQRT